VTQQKTFSSREKGIEQKDDRFIEYQDKQNENEDPEKNYTSYREMMKSYEERENQLFSKASHLVTVVE
jgi:hypothetical protein